MITEIAIAAAWKHNTTPGLRFFENPARPARLGYTDEKCAELGVTVARVSDFAIVWPTKLGPVPTIEQLQEWVTEWKSATSSV